MWELRKWGWGPKLPFNSIQPKRKKDNLFILLTKRNMQKLTCYTRWPTQWQLSTTCLPLLCSAYMSIGSASKVLIARFHERAVSPKQKLKINQLENILNLIGQGLCNSIWLREGPETVRRPSLNIFSEHVKADLNWSACVSEHHCLCEAIKAQKKSYSFIFQTTNKGWWWLLWKQSCGVAPAEITDSREHLTTLKKENVFR